MRKNKCLHLHIHLLSIMHSPNRRKRTSRIAAALTAFPPPLAGTLLVVLAAMLSPVFVFVNVLMSLCEKETRYGRS